jgi:hypothetical protein
MMAPPIASRPGRHEGKRSATPSPRKSADDEYVEVTNGHPPDEGEPDELHIDVELPETAKQEERGFSASDTDGDGTA